MNDAYWRGVTVHTSYLTVDVTHRSITPRRNAPYPDGNRAKRRKENQEAMRLAWHEWVRNLA